MYYLRFLFRTEVIHLLSKSKENKLSHRCCHLVFIKNNRNDNCISRDCFQFDNLFNLWKKKSFWQKVLWNCHYQNAVLEFVIVMTVCVFFQQTVGIHTCINCAPLLTDVLRVYMKLLNRRFLVDNSKSWCGKFSVAILSWYFKSMESCATKYLFHVWLHICSIFRRHNYLLPISSSITYYRI